MFKKKLMAILMAFALLLATVPSNFMTVQNVKAQSTAANRRVVGYLPSYRSGTFNSIDFSALTHCILSFATYSGGTLTNQFSAEQTRTVVQKCHNAGAKCIIAVGGWGGFQNDGILTTDAGRTNLVNQIMGIVNTYGLDGVDIDIELEDASIWNNFDAFISKLSAQLRPNGKSLSMAVSTWFTGSIANSTYNYFDFLNLMSYDANNNGSGDHAPQSLINNMISYYSQRGVSNDRLVIGVPFYGYGPGGAVTYAEMVGRNAANADKDYADGVYYNGKSTIRSKAEFSKSYGGTMIWEIGQDTYDNNSLLKVIKDVMANGDNQQQTQQPQQTTQPQTTTQNNNSQYKAWSASDVYVKDNMVSYNGAVYKAKWWTQGETPGSAAVWELVSGNVETTQAPTTTTQAQQQTQQPQTTTQPQQQTTTREYTPITNNKRLMIGYYHTWDNAGNPFLKLRDVDKNWDVINISFSEPQVAGSTNGKMKFEISGLSASYTKDDFKNDVKALQAQGKKIVISIGGYEGYFSLDSQAAINQFVSDIKGYVDEYGFDGIDIDLEQSSVNFDQGNDTDIRTINSPRLKNMTTAIRTICESYGSDFILSWAPETFYVQMGYMYYAGINQYCDARAGSYLPMINALRDITSFVHVQLYNSIQITAPDGVTYNMGNKDGVVAMCKMLLDGFYVGAGANVPKSEKTWFAPLRPDQVVIGVPSSTSAAGSGQISNKELQEAFAELDAAYPGVRGIMSWSINWDSSQNGNSFVQQNKSFLNTFGGTTEFPTQQPQQQTTQPQQQTTTQPQQQTTTQSKQEDQPQIGNNIEINGCQISTTTEGFRVVYSADSTDSNIASVGMIYGIAAEVNPSEMVVGSSNQYVNNYQATEIGKLEKKYSSNANFDSYAMTMKFIKTSQFFTNKIYVRAYAKMKDGSYKYSVVKEVTVYNLADDLYKNNKMSNITGHNYLYDNILKVVNPSYAIVKYDMKNTLA